MHNFIVNVEMQQQMLMKTVVRLCVFCSRKVEGGNMETLTALWMRERQYEYMQVEYFRSVTVTCLAVFYRDADRASRQKDNALLIL